MTHTTIGTADRRLDVQQSGTYDIYIEIDCDCEELVDACGLDYKQCEDDDTQNEVCISLDKDEYIEAITDSMWASHDLNEQSISAALLNPELGEYTTKVTIYKPNGDIISFY
jgi:hypothetical protein